MQKPVSAADPGPQPAAPPDRRQSNRKPIRLRVTYKSARSLVTEYTSCVSKGGCKLSVRRALPIGTTFVFEMFAKGQPTPIEVEGTVVRCEETPDGQHELAIEYTSNERLTTLEGLLEQILGEQRFEKSRRHPRVPVNLVAQDSEKPSHKYLIRDISRSGLGLRLPSNEKLPKDLTIGSKIRLAVELKNRPLAEFKGEIAWQVECRPGLVHAALGIHFPVVAQRLIGVLEALMRLERPLTTTVSLRPSEPAK